MNDSSSKLENDNELKFAREQGFFDKSFGIKLLIGLVFMFSLFSILHFREVKVEVVELGSQAQKYTVAQTDFDFFDEEATIILKQEAVRDIGKIYKITDKEIRQRRAEFENFLIKDEEWRNNVEGTPFDEMYKGIDSVEKTLHSLRFSDLRTLQKMSDLSLSSEYSLNYAPSDVTGPISLPPQIWEAASKLSFPAVHFSPKAADYIMKYFRQKFWTLEQDIPMERNLRRKIQAQVPEKYTHVSSGSRIIDQGDKVTSRHIAILQAMKNALNEQRNISHIETILGSLILSILLTVLASAYVAINYPEVIVSNRKLFLIVTIIMITFAIAKVTEFFFLSSKGNLIEVIRYPLFVPLSAILLCSLLSSAIATFTSAFITIILLITLAFDTDGFILLNLTAALVTILSARTLRQRKEVFIVCGKAWLCCIVVIISLHLYQNTNWEGLITDTVSSGGFLLLTAVLVVGLLPLFESTFSIMTDVTLMEYMDPNHDLLRRLSIEAPGTYQHSVVVGNLAEAAALAIGANGLFCRVATLYHDVGKMATPQYFTENQHGGMNIHQLLTPQESAHVIIAHIAEGVSLARKAGLPEQFVNIIKEHHGTTLVYYFYRKELEKAGGDKSKVDQQEFRYSGPKPRSKEAGIIMIADSLEAASRSLDKITEESVMELTNRIVKDKAEDGQFDLSLLTLEELARVKETLVKTLVAYGHSRVKYPRRDIGEETLRDD